MTDPDPVADRLAAIERAYGRHALTDPVALRAAWRATGGGEPPADLLAGLGGTPRATETGVPPPTPGSGDPGSPSAPTLAPTVGSPTDPSPSGPQLTWDDTQVVTAGGEPVGSGRRRRGLIVAAAAGAVVLVAAGVVAGVALTRPAAPTAAPDPYSPAAVTDRYRALGADLLVGASRCSGDRAEPGELERVRCDVDGLTLVLRTYDSLQRLRERREAAVPTADVVRSVRRTRDEGAIAFTEQRTGLSTVSWDARDPRPVSATVEASTSLLDLTAFLDTRRFGLVPPPDVPGPQFRSGALWSLAARIVEFEPSVTCRAVVPDASERESVQCRSDDGSRSQFALLRDRESFLAARNAFADLDEEKQAEGRSVTAWDRPETEGTVGVLAQYVQVSDASPALYYDDDALGGYGVLFGPPGSSQAPLLELFIGGG